MAAATSLPAPTPDLLVLGGSDGPSIADVVAVARDRRPVALAPGVSERLRVARASLEAAAASGSAVYGLTTGLGAAVDTRLSPDDLADFQRRAIPARAVAVGAYLTREEVRATLACRLAGLARGASGITPAFLDTIAALLNRGVHPVARRTGSLGEADLAPLAGLFQVLAGGGEAELDGAILPGPEALARAGIVAPPLGPKDGLALINSNAATVGCAALALADADRVLGAAIGAGALALEAFRANLSVIDSAVTALRPAPGQAAMAARLRALLAGSDLLEPGAARRVQDPLSFRCLAPVAGWAVLKRDDVEAALAAELAGAGDSPAFLAGTGTYLSTVNFDTTAIALAFEALGQAFAHAATLSAFRITKLMSPAVSDLPRFLARDPSRNGFATAGKTVAVLEAEIRRHALPVGPITMPVADGIEDYAPSTPLIVEKTRALVAAAARLAAIELVIAGAAFERRTGARPGRGTAALLAKLREIVPPFDDDRATGEDFEAVAVAILDGAFAEAAA